MAGVILHECWCEEAEAGDYSPDFWRVMARFGKVLSERGLKPIHVVSADRYLVADKACIRLAIACEPGCSETPFWKWWHDQRPAMNWAA